MVSLYLLPLLVPLVFARSQCDVTKFVPTLPAGLSVPAGEVTLFIGHGTGTQNYTCGTDGKFASNGAVATLVDISCTPRRKLHRRNRFQPRQGTKLGFHNFIAPGKPYFDFQESQGAGQFIVSTKVNGVKAPNTATDVDILQLKQTSGDLSKSVFRVNTKGGQPPTSCTPGQTAEVPYQADYVFTGTAPASPAPAPSSTTANRPTGGAPAPGPRPTGGAPGPRPGGPPGGAPGDGNDSEDDGDEDDSGDGNDQEDDGDADDGGDGNDQEDDGDADDSGDGNDQEDDGDADDSGDGADQEDDGDSDDSA